MNTDIGKLLTGILEIVGSLGCYVQYRFVEGNSLELYDIDSYCIDNEDGVDSFKNLVQQLKDLKVFNDVRIID